MKKRIVIAVNIAVLVLAALAHFGTPAPVLAGTFAGVNGRLAYINSSLHPSSMKTDGTNQTELVSTSSPTVSYSPDGTKITYATPNGASHIFVANADGSNAVQITSGSALDTQPVWSVNGGKITFLSFRSGIDPYYLIYNINPDGTGKTLLADVGTSPSDLTYSPDGTKIAFVKSALGDGNDIYTMNSDGTNQTVVITGDGHEDDPRFSPDGTKIVYDRFDGSDYEIYTANVNGTGKTQLTSNSSSEFHPAFSPDGTKIVFARHIGGMSNYNLYMMNTDGTSQTLVVSTTVGDYVDWQPLTIEPTSSNPNPTITSIGNAPVTVDVPSLYTDVYGGVDNGSVSITDASGNVAYSVNPTTGVITITPSLTAFSATKLSFLSKLDSIFFPKVSAATNGTVTYQICSQASSSLCSSGTITVVLAASVSGSSGSLADTGDNTQLFSAMAIGLILGGTVLLTKTWRARSR